MERERYLAFDLIENLAILKELRSLINFLAPQIYLVLQLTKCVGETSRTPSSMPPEATPSTPSVPKCTKCHKVGTAAAPLKQRAKCNGSTPLYRSRACQTGHKQHKKVCASQAAERQMRLKDVGSGAENEGNDEESGDEDDSDDRPQLKDLLLAVPSKEAVYKEIIHIIRDDIKIWNRDSERDSDMTPLKSKKKKKEFFGIALSGYQRRSSLPAWWDEGSRFDCQKLADKMNYRCLSTALPSD